MPRDPDSHSRLLYCRKDAARQLSISIRSLDYLLAQKKLNALRKGKKVLIPHGELLRYAQSNDYSPFAA